VISGETAAGSARVAGWSVRSDFRHTEPEQAVRNGRNLFN
jgi:hypothetical protein